MKKLTRLGVVHDGVRAGEIRDVLNDALDMDTMKGSAPVRMFKASMKFATSMYQTGDDFWKVVGWENEKSALMRAGMEEDAAETEAAKRVRDMYPTYSMVPEGIQWLRRFPLAGTFVSFPWEIMRTTANSVKYVKEDIQAGRNLMAARRMTGMVTAGAWSYAAVAVLSAILGIDDETDEAVRRLGPPWQQNAQLAYLDIDEDGYTTHLDLSHLDPYAYIKMPINALFNGNFDTVEQRVTEGLKELLSPFLGPEIAASAIGEVAFNKRMNTGGQIYDDTATVIEKGAKAFEHLRKSLQPGVFSNLERTLKAFNEQIASYGKPYNLKDESLAWVGFRLTTIDPNTSLRFSSYDFSDARRDASRPIYSVIRNPNQVSERQIKSASKTTIERWERSFEDMQASVKAAKTFGLTDSEIRNILKDAGVPRKYMRPLLEGFVPRWSPSSSVFTEAMRSVTTNPSSKVNRVQFRERRRMVNDYIRELQEKD